MELNQQISNPSRDIQEIQIIQFNCNKANGGQEREFFEALHPKFQHIIAIQEPQILTSSLSTKVPIGYRLALYSHAATRVAFLVSKELDPSSWSVLSLSRDVACLLVKTKGDPLGIINVYNPGPQSQRQGQRSALPEVQRALCRLQRQRSEVDILLLGDFNLHHPNWGGPNTTPDQEAAGLIGLVDQFGLDLITPVGTVTFRRGSRKSTIDLAFSSPALTQRVHSLQVLRDQGSGKDHYPIVLKLGTQIPEPTSIPRFAIQKLNQPQFRSLLIANLQQLNFLPDDLQMDEDNNPTVAEDFQIDPTGQTGEIEQRALDLTEAIHSALAQSCSLMKPSYRAKRGWSQKCQTLVKERRRARRRAAASRDPEDYAQASALRNQIKAQIKEDGTRSWREFLAEVSRKNTKTGDLWRIAKWARKKANRPPETPQLPPLRRTENQTPTTDFQAKADLLAARFFPAPVEADLGDLEEASLQERIQVPQEVDRQEIEGVIQAVPRKKAPGPDRIPNEALKAAAQLISPILASITSSCFQQGYFPKCFHHSITVVLRKEGKDDYSLPKAYRPIALENTLAKIIEKLLAERLTEVLERHSLLPPTQFGARKHRSVNTALTFLTELTRAAWRVDPANIVSVLSLDLTGAFDNVSHPRLLETVQKKGLPTWISDIIQGFLKDRRTSLLFDGQITSEIPTETGIPQGSPLSPILFLIFISPLLEQTNSEYLPQASIGFVDDTNLVVWSPSAQRNCRILERIHQTCLIWAQKSGASFAPDKYQLIHLTRKRRADTTACIQIPGFDGKPQKALKVLGVWIDPRLDWKKHIHKAAERGGKQLAALVRITGSTWGLSFERSRLLYTATIRSSLTHGAPVWALGEEGEGLPSQTTKPLTEIQHQCLRIVTGSFKRAAGTALEQETQVPPVTLYALNIAREHAAGTSTTTAANYSTKRINQILSHCQQCYRSRTQGWKTPRQRAVHQTKSFTQAHSGTQEGQSSQRQQETWLKQQWKQAFTKAAQGKTNAAWKTTSSYTGPELREGLTRSESSILTQLRTGNIGLNQYLANRRVPGILPQCRCGHPKETISHFLLFCPDHPGRPQMLAEAGTRDLAALISQKIPAQAVVRWIYREGLLPQFVYARNLGEMQDQVEDWLPIEELGI